MSKPNRYHYTVYGLHLISNLPLSEAPLARAQVEGTRPVQIHFAGDIGSLPVKQPDDQYTWYTHPYKDEDGIPALQVWRDEAVYYLAYLGGIHCVVDRNGDNLWTAWSERNDFGIVAAQILGVNLGLVAHLRGFYVLHASVAAWNNQALAILGRSGTGKSTTAAELHRQGCQIVSDDMAVLQYAENAWWVQPGYPRLRLWPEIAEALYGPEHNLRPIAPGLEDWDKRYLELDPESTAFATSPLPIKAIFALDWGNGKNKQIRIQPLSGVDALSNLDTNGFAVSILDQNQRMRQMAGFGRLLEQTAVFRVEPTADVKALPELGKAILACFKNTL